MVTVAWAGGQSAGQDRRSGERDCALQRDLCPVCGIGQGVVGIAYVHREQPVFDPELRRALSQRRADRDWVCGVDSERSGEQTILQKTTNAVVQRRGAFVVTDASADAERGIGRYLQALVSGPGHEGWGAPDSGVTPSISMLSTASSVGHWQSVS